MDTKIVTTGFQRLAKHIALDLLATGWYFTDKLPSDASFPQKRGPKGCVFTKIKKLFKGGNLCFSLENAGCYGASCYLGFTKPDKNAGAFLSETEGFKKNRAFAQAFYKDIKARTPQKKYIVIENLNNIDKNRSIEIINLWTRPIHLSGLITLANYDSPDNDNVIFPLASGCQSIWTIPYKEKQKEEPKSVVGTIDPAIRKYLPDDILSFSVSTERFVEMTDNISGSFLEKASWLTLINKRTKK
ncbi:MAG: DUF169 domain-containing protein [Desulfobacteraceae bacterium]|nr:DUF169 domain-containing protein [Desulfobacteraceae bacterium]